MKGGRRYAWSSTPVISTIILGTACLVALGFWEVYADLKYPMLPPRLFRRVREFTMVLVICFVGGMLYYSMNVLWPRQSGLLFVPANKPIIAGVYANMVSFGTILAGLVTAVFCQRIGHERWQQVTFMVRRFCEPHNMWSLNTFSGFANSVDWLSRQRWNERQNPSHHNDHSPGHYYNTSSAAQLRNDINGH